MGDQTPRAAFDWRRLLPKYWLQNEPTDRTWDAMLNAALDRFGVAGATRHTCQVGPFNVWAANWPYSYGNLYHGYTGLPTVRTRLRLRRAIEALRTAEFARLIASAIDAGTGETADAGSIAAGDESAVAESETPNA